jgi:hypothetical protein
MIRPHLKRANEVVGDPHRLERIVLCYMLVLVEFEINPTWKTFQDSPPWRVLEKNLTMESQRKFYDAWEKLYSTISVKGGGA